VREVLSGGAKRHGHVSLIPDRASGAFAELRHTRHHLQARDHAATVTLQLLDAVAARGAEGIVASARGAFDELECPVGFWSATSPRTPVRMSATEVCLANADFAVANADQWSPTGGTTRLHDVLTFCAHDRIHLRLPNTTGSRLRSGSLRSRAPGIWPCLRFVQVWRRFDLLGSEPRRAMDKLHFSSLHAS
jgi:hypothetical protein